MVSIVFTLKRLVNVCGFPHANKVALRSLLRPLLNLLLLLIGLHDKKMKMNRDFELCRSEIVLKKSKSDMISQLTRSPTTLSVGEYEWLALSWWGKGVMRMQWHASMAPGSTVRTGWLVGLD